MIKAIRQDQETSNPRYCVADAETDEAGHVLVVGFAYYDSDDQRRYESFPTWLAFLQRAVALALQSEAYRYIYAHNGAGFDWLSLAQDLQESGLDYQLTAILSGEKGIGFNIRVQDRITLRLRDSLCLLPEGLAKLCEDFSTEHQKIDLHGRAPAIVLADSRALFYDYNMADCFALQDILREYHLLINRHVGPLKRLSTTASALSMKMWQSCYLQDGIMTTWNEKQNSFFRRAYHGGRVSVIHPGIWHDVSVYDINSMYAYIMRDREFPVSYKGAWTDEYYPDRMGIYEVEFRQPNTKIPPILCDETLREFAYQGAGVFASPELQVFLENGGQLQVKQGWYFTRTGTPFRDYMQHLWELRQLAKQQHNRGLDLAAKLLANSLYGKFGQRPERSVIRTLKPGELKRLVDGGAQVKLYNDYVMIKEPAHMENGFVALAAFITSYARAYLYDWLLMAGEDALYCDTDSVHCTATLPSGLELGDMKLEKQFADVVYLRKKMYGYRQPDGYEGFVIKGLPTCPLTYEELEDIAAWNQQYCVSYETPPTIREVLLNREPAAKWKKRSFTISAVPVGAKL